MNSEANDRSRGLSCHVVGRVRWPMVQAVKSGWDWEPAPLSLLLSSPLSVKGPVQGPASSGPGFALAGRVGPTPAGAGPAPDRPRVVAFALARCRPGPGIGGFFPGASASRPGPAGSARHRRLADICRDPWAPSPICRDPRPGPRPGGPPPFLRGRARSPVPSLSGIGDAPPPPVPRCRGSAPCSRPPTPKAPAPCGAGARP
jgi:hypothetical protein